MAGKPYIVVGKVLDAKYYPEAGTYLLIVRDTLRNKNFKPVEVSPLAFGISPQLSPSLHEFFVDQLRKRIDPIRIEFQGDKDFDQAVKRALERQNAEVNDDITKSIEKSGEMMEKFHEEVKKDDFILKQIFKKD